MRLTVNQIHITRVPVEIPTEVLGYICSHLDKLSLKSVRQVCQTFNFAASPHLFTRAHTSVHPFDHDILFKISEHPIFSKSVRELVCHVRQLDIGMTHREAYVAEMKYHFGPGSSSSTGLSWLDLTQAVVDEGFEEYCRLHRQQEESKKEEAQLKCLRIVLPRMRNVRAVSFAYTWGRPDPHPWGPQRGYYHHDKEYEPPSPLTRLWNPQHARPRGFTSGMTGMRHEDVTRRGMVNMELPVIVKALSQGDLVTRIKSLDIGQDPQHGSFHGSFQDRFDQYLPLEHSSSVFKSLTHINISVPTARLSRDVPAEGSPLAQLLSATESLRFLALDFEGNLSLGGVKSDMSLRELIGSPTFRELRFFSFGSLVVKVDEILGFLDRHRGPLRDLRLKEIFGYGSRDTWASFLDSVRDLGLALTSFEVAFSWGGDGRGGEMGRVFDMVDISSATLMSFLDGDCKNPIRIRVK